MTIPVIRSWESIDFVELILLVSPQRHCAILKMMHLWLTGEVYHLENQATPEDLGFGVGGDKARMIREMER